MFARPAIGGGGRAGIKQLEFSPPCVIIDEFEDGFRSEKLRIN